MKRIKKTNAFVCVLLFCCVFSFAENSKPLRVLFIGNSYTGWHNLPEIVAQMANSKGKRLYYESINPGGRNFEKHWMEGNALKAIYQNKWDIVMLQNFSYEGVGNPENMRKYGIRFTDAIEETDARPCFYITPAYREMREWMKDKPEDQERFKQMQELVNDAYFALAVETDARVSPVGVAWDIVRKQYPEIELHHEDGTHPSKLGGYLTGLVMFAVLFEQELDEMPAVIYPYLTPELKEKRGSEIRVPAEVRLILEAAANEAIKIAQERLELNTTKTTQR
ncbi:hypothetical protein MLD52_06165 [Puniceicoccaceae bacterium K14]|nr:hypothetical protein [Puniceicoccaceae bacterium K14]